MLKFLISISICFGLAIGGGCGGGSKNCLTHASTFCSEGVVYWANSCGDLEEVKENCECGCESDHSGCKKCGCIKDCTGMECGLDPVCGESCGTCPGNLTCNNGNCICSSHDDCDENSICIYEECTIAYGRMYRLTVVSAEVSENDQNGEAWDWPGGMPDPTVCFYKDYVGTPTGPTGAEFCTSEKQDTYTPTYNESFETALYGSDKWLIVAFDEDVTDYELIEGARAEPIEVSWIKVGGFQYQGDYLLDLLVDVDPVQ